MVMRVLVTGGTGYVGRKLLCQLKADSRFQPVAFARSTAGVISLERLLDQDVHQADLLNEESLRTVLRDGVDGVVHLAAEMDFHPKDPARVLRVNVDGTCHLLEACAEAASQSKHPIRPIRFVYVSSTEAMGPNENTSSNSPADEQSPLHPDCDYGHSKVLAEDIVRKFSSDQVECVILRPTGIFGTNEQFFFREMVTAVEQGLTCVSLGPMSGTLTLTHVDDVVRAVVLTLQKPQAVGETYIVASNEFNHTYKEIIERISRALGRAPPQLELPESVARFAFKIISPLMNLGRKRTFLFHTQTLDHLTARRSYSNAKIKRELGFEPAMSMLDGIESVIREDVARGVIQKHRIPPLVSATVSMISLLAFAILRLSGASFTQEN